MENVCAALGILVWMLLPFPCSAAQSAALPLEGAYNVRDLGGYPAAGGSNVIYGRVFRAGDLNKLTPNDLRLLEERSIRTVIDFRTEKEKREAPHKLPASVTQVLPLVIRPGDIKDLSAFTEEDTQRFMIQLNRSLVTDHQASYAAFFKALSSFENTPLLFNCSAGKDRTGLAAALFLASLGVDRDIIYQDYLLSAVYVKDKYAQLVAKNPRLAPLFTVQKEYLEAAFDEIDTRYGGVENYLRKQLGVDTALMKRLYCE